MDCNQIKVFINLEVIEEDNYQIHIYIYIYFLKNLKKKFCNVMKPFGATIASKSNFDYIIYDIDYR